MKYEIEAKFVLLDLSSIRRLLSEACGAPRQARYLMRRRIYDYADLRLDAHAAWVRVRDEGWRTVLSYKQRQSETLGGMIELETTVGDFDEACRILEAIGMTEKAYQENYREIWDYMECEIALDEWPWIPPVVEVEAADEADVRAASLALGLMWSDAVFDSTDAVYQRFYDVSRTEVSTVRLTFEQQPDVLMRRRRATNPIG